MTMLRNMGCTVLLSNNGKEAVDLAIKEEFYLILMDCQML